MSSSQDKQDKWDSVRRYKLNKMINKLGNISGHGTELVTVYIPPRKPIYEIVSQLRNEHKVNVVIVLSHLGYQYDKKLADGVPGIDIILGGHTHHLLEDIEKHRNTYLGATGKFGEYVGEIVLTIDEKTGEWIGVKGRVHPVACVEPHPRMLQLLTDYSYEADRQLSHPVIELKVEAEVVVRGD